MSLPEVYLHAAGMLNALGNDVDAIARALAAGQSPGMQPLSTPRGERFVGRVLAPLAQPLDALRAAASGCAPAAASAVTGNGASAAASVATSAVVSATRFDGRTRTTSASAPAAARIATFDCASAATFAATPDFASVAMSAATSATTSAFASAATSAAISATSSPASLPALAPFDCRNNRLLLAALAQIASAIEAARARYGSQRIGVVLGTSTSGVSAAEAALTRHRATGMLPASFDYRSMEIGTAAPFAALALDLGGPAFTVSTACTSSAKALVSARRLLQYGLCDAVIAGGVDTLCELTLQGFGALESVSPARTNPMSRNRRGINLGEGAAVFLLSREEAPVALVGAGESSDAHHISAPDPHGAGAEKALRAALADARIAAGDVGYVNLHATATPKNDQMEARLMARVFPAGVAASGTKPLTGHMLGAAGAAEIGLAWIALTRAACPLPVHLWDGEADPELPPLDLVGAGRYLPGAPGARYVMSNSFAFGGSNASLILRG